MPNRGSRFGQAQITSIDNRQVDEASIDGRECGARIFGLDDLAVQSLEQALGREPRSRITPEWDGAGRNGHSSNVVDIEAGEAEAGTSDWSSAVDCSGRGDRIGKKGGTGSVGLTGFFDLGVRPARASDEGKAPGCEFESRTRNQESLRDQIVHNHRIS